jgi:hypothetical protein
VKTPQNENTPEVKPDKIEVLRIGRWRTDHLDQQMIRTMRKIADKRGATIEEVMDSALADFVERCIADNELPTKIIPFPIKRRPNRNTSREDRRAAACLPVHPRSKEAVRRCLKRRSRSQMS